jgi:two-component system, sensor histidine kinase RegB
MSSSRAELTTVHWLLRLRWGALFGTMAVLSFAGAVLRLELTLLPIATILGLQTASALALSFTKPTERILPWLMTFDIVMFTALLWFTGGPSNPFNFLYLVYIALSAMVLPMRWAWLLTALALAGYALLFLAGDGTHHLHMMKAHLQGMWVAFLVAALFIVYFVQRITSTLAEKERALKALAERAERKNRLTSLATLAAGAAHELATPLSSIAVIAHDLATLGAPQARSDGQAIRTLVAQCHSILSQMAHQGGESRGEQHVAVSFQRLLTEVCANLGESTRIQLRVPPDCSVIGPPRALSQAVSNVVRNALQASSSVVEVGFEPGPVFSCLHVKDAGPGIDEKTLGQVGEPFFTTKPSGQGTGLGVFLARAVVEQLNGRLDISSTPREGTLVSFKFPSALVQAK